MKMNTKIARNFIFCFGNMLKDEEFIHSNTGSGNENSFLFILNGDGYANDTPIKFGLNDLRQFLGSPIKYKAGPDGFSWVCINFTNYATFTAEALKEGTSTVTTTNKQKIVACVAGSASIENKELNQLSYTIIPADRSVTLTINQSSYCIVLTRET